MTNRWNDFAPSESSNQHDQDNINAPVRALPRVNVKLGVLTDSIRDPMLCFDEESASYLRQPSHIASNNTQHTVTSG